MPYNTSLTPEGIRNIEKVMRQSIDRGIVPGCAVAIGRGEDRVYSHYAGCADRGSNTPIREDTVYRLYSMTKPVTVVALLQLYEQGLFQMVQPVSDFLPGFKNPRVYERASDGTVTTRPASREVTLYDLFTMTSGIPYEWGVDPAAEAFRNLMQTMRADEKQGRPWNTVKAANETGKLPLSFDPGERFRYGFSIDVLGGVLEAITGQPLDVYCRDNIFRPLGMNDTGWALTDSLRPHLAHLYEADETGALTDITGSAEDSRYENPTFISGGGGLLGTLGDYFRFAGMLHRFGTFRGVRILGRKTIEMMSSAHLTPAQQATYHLDMCNHRGYTYGLGVRVNIDPAHNNMLGSAGEWGWSGAAGTWVMMDPAEDFFLVYMHQRMPADHDLYVPELVSAAYSALR